MENRISKREFLKLSVVGAAAALLAACNPDAAGDGSGSRVETNSTGSGGKGSGDAGTGYPVEGSAGTDKSDASVVQVEVVPATPKTEKVFLPEHSAIEGLDNMLSQTERVLGSEAQEIQISHRGQSGDLVRQLFSKEGAVWASGGVNQETAVTVVLQPELQQQLETGFSPLMAAAVGTMENGALGPLILGVSGLAATIGMFANELSKDGLTVNLLELNPHAKERRGLELATMIGTVVEAAFMSPNSPFNDERLKKILCAGAGVVADCVQAVQYIVEVESRSKPGVRRIVSVIMGTEDGVIWKPITGLYKTGTVDNYVEKQYARNWSSNCNNLPPTGAILGQ